MMSMRMHADSKIALLTVFFLIRINLCQGYGFSCSNGCASEQEMGGEIRITILEAQNLPNTDHFGATSGVTDPYVRMSIGTGAEQVVRTSDYVRNSLNPVWVDPKPVNFGTKLSGSAITFDMMDADTGFEFADDFIASGTENVIACDQFTTGTEVVDGLTVPKYWCEETSWVPLQEGVTDCTQLLNGTKPMCVKVKMYMLTFAIEVDRIYSDVSRLKSTTVAGEYGTRTLGAGGTLGDHWGRPYVDTVQEKIDGRYIFFQKAFGGLIPRVYQRDRMWIGDKYIKIKATLPFELYIFRHNDDDAPNKTPLWLKGPSWTDGATRMHFKSHFQPNDYFTSVKTRLPAGEHTLPGQGIGKVGGPTISMRYMYVPVAKMIISSDSDDGGLFDLLDRVGLLLTLAEYGPLALLSAYMCWQVLKQVRFDVGLLPSWLADQQLGGSKKHILGALFICDQESRDNMDYRRHLWFATAFMQLMLFIPHLLLITLGAVLIITVKPAAMGVAVAILGPMVMLFKVTLNRWRIMGWRMTHAVLQQLLLCLLLFFTFLAGCLLVDPRLTQAATASAAAAALDPSGASAATEPLSLPGLTWVFLSLHALPVVALAFARDPELRSASDQQRRAVTRHEGMIPQTLRMRLAWAQGGTVAQQKAAGGNFSHLLLPGHETAGIHMLKPKKKKKKKKKGPTRAEVLREKAWAAAQHLLTHRPVIGASVHNLVGSSISLDNNVKEFALQDYLVAHPMADDDEEAELKVSKKGLRRLQGVALGLLVLYGLVAQAYCSPSDSMVAWGLCLAVLILDSAPALLVRRSGGGGWGPGFTCAITCASRACLCANAGELWVLGVSAAFLITGGSVAMLVVNVHLKLPSSAEVTAIAFDKGDVLAGGKAAGAKNKAKDSSSAPEFVLGILSLSFLLSLLGLAFSASPPVLVIGGDAVPAFAFGLAALLLVPCASLAVASARAKQLETRGLLGYSGYLYFEWAGLPEQLAGAFQLLLILSGGVLYAVLGWPALLLVSFMAAPLLLTGYLLYTRWVANDYSILPSFWDPELRLKVKMVGGLTAEEEARQLAKARAEAMASGSEFVLPDLVRTDGTEDTELDMPALPGADVAPVMGETKQVDEDEGLPDDVDPRHMHAPIAFLKGRLALGDYICFGLLVFFQVLLLIFGRGLSEVVNPSWVGPAVAAGIFEAQLVLSVALKWHNIFRWTWDMFAVAAVASVSLLIGFLSVFTTTLESDLNSDGTLALGCLLIVSVGLLLLYTSMRRWKDAAWKPTLYVKVALPGAMFLLLITALIGMIWGGLLLGVGFILIWFLLLTALVFVRGWAANGKYIPMSYQRVAHTTLLLAAVGNLVLAWLYPENLMFFAVLACLCGATHLLAPVIGTWVLLPPGASLAFSAFLFPVFVLQPSGELQSINSIASRVYSALAIGIAGGAASAIFNPPLTSGVAICCLSVTIGVVMTLSAISSSHTAVGSAVACADEPTMRAAALTAEEASIGRRAPLTVSCAEYGGIQDQNNAAQRSSYGQRRRLDKQKAANEKPNAYVSADALFQIERKLTYRNPAELGQGLRRRDHLNTFWDIVWDAVQYGRGPLGAIAVFGVIYHYSEQYCTCCVRGRKRKVLKKVPNPDDENGPPLLQYEDDETKYPLLPEARELLVARMKRSADLDAAFSEEYRCAQHFKLLLLSGGAAVQRHQSAQLKRFLHEQRFKLAAAGVRPPAALYQSASASAVDIMLLVQWLMRLTPEQHQRFSQLRAAFDAACARTLEQQEAEDAQLVYAADALMWERQQQEWAMAQRMYDDTTQRRIKRQAEGREMPEGVPEDIVCAQEALREISEGSNCVPGDGHRESQYVDPNFPPEARSVGMAAAGNMIVEWRPSSSINPKAGLFQGGTDPDDVYQGVLHDGWLLSAISIVAASGGVDDGAVDALLANLFVNDDTSPVGAYVVRLYKNGQWEWVLLDDWLPVLSDQYKDTICAGTAFAYSKNLDEIWVAILEKAFAKYYGCYAALERGFVHHALKDLTGAESEMIALSASSRGAGREQLWANLRRFADNGYLLGAGTMASDGASESREQLDNGLVFGAVYVVYRVLDVDGLRLLHLRNPPGDHGEWNGDWSDNSPLWTRRLKFLLDVKDDADDGCFWMSFDDFCLSFRHLYVCRYYHPDTWFFQQEVGWWRTEDATAAGLPNKQHNPECKLEANPQYALVAPRPIDICILVSQTDDGIATGEPHPISAYLLKSDMGDGKAGVVKELSTKTVITTTGDPQRSHEVRLYASLPAGAYTLLTGTFLANCEGPHTVKLWSNYACNFQRLWPPPWKEKSTTEKLAGLAKEKGGKMAAKAAESASLVAGKLAEEMKDGDVGEDDPFMDELTQAQWKKKWDEGKQAYYFYNKETGISQWEKPPGFRDE